MNNNELNLLAKLLKGDNKCIPLTQAFKNFILNATIDTSEQTQIYYNKLWKKLSLVMTELGLKTTNDITKITYKHIQLELKQLNYSNNSINKFTDVLKMVIKYNFEMEYISVNNIIGIKKLTKDTKPIKIIDKNLKEKIMNYFDNLPLDFLNTRNISFMRLFAESGLRLNELLNIKLENLSLHENEIFLEFTKTKKTRFIYFGDSTKNYLEKYLRFRRSDSPFLFINTKGTKLLSNSVYLFIEKIKRDLNVTQSISPHKWRHTLATFLLEEKINIDQVRDILGHSELGTTKIYIHTDKKKTKSAVLEVL